MAAPGTLIPADILSVKDTAFNPYNPIKIPALQSSSDSGLVYSRSNRLIGEGSSQGSTAGGSSTVDRGSSSGKTEPSPSFQVQGNEPAASSPGLPSRVTPNQVDNLATSVVGNPLYKGGRGSSIVTDGVRMNVNVVPYGQNGQEDPKNLFADLNPFHIKGTGKNSFLNKPVENVEEFHKHRNNPVPGRPPSPMMWKNQNPYNEVPRKKDFNYKEGILPKINREPNNYNPSLTTSTSSAASEKFYPHGLKSSGNANLSIRDNDARNNMPGSALQPTSSTNQPNQRPSVEDSSQNIKEETHRDSGNVKFELLGTVKEPESNEIGYHDRRKCTHDRFMGSNLKLKDPESETSSVNSGTGRVDEIFDDVDVSECEIPWEDLVLGERIGLGGWCICPMNSLLFYLSILI